MADTRRSHLRSGYGEWENRECLVLMLKSNLDHDEVWKKKDPTQGCTNLEWTPIEEWIRQSRVHIRRWQMLPNALAVRLLGVFGSGRLVHRTSAHFSL